MFPKFPVSMLVRVALTPSIPIPPPGPVAVFVRRAGESPQEY